MAYLSPPTIDELRTLLEILEVPARVLLREEPECLALALADPAKTDDELIAAMVAHPRLIEHPIFVHEGLRHDRRPSACLSARGANSRNGA